jgi:hypothetical protein
MNVKNADKCPEYIDKFLKDNMEQLVNIYDAGYSNMGEGCLGFNCSLKDNKMDVFYMDIELIKKTIGDVWENIKKKDKKLFYVRDFDGYGDFLIYI